MLQNVVEGKQLLVVTARTRACNDLASRDWGFRHSQGRGPCGQQGVAAERSAVPALTPSCRHPARIRNLRHEVVGRTSPGDAHRRAHDRSTSLSMGSHRSLIDWSGGGRQAHQTSEGSLSAVSTPIFASKYSFLQHFSRFTRLSHFGPFRLQNFIKVR